MGMSRYHRDIPLSRLDGGVWDSTRETGPLGEGQKVDLSPSATAVVFSLSQLSPMLRSFSTLLSFNS